MKNKFKISLIGLMLATTLAGCSGQWQGVGVSTDGDKAATKQVNTVVKQLQDKTKTKQSLSKQQWEINNQRQIFVNKNDAKSLDKLSNTYFKNQNKITNLSSQIEVLNQKLASMTSNKKTVNDNGTLITYPKAVPNSDSTSSSSN